MATFAERFTVYNTPGFQARIGIALARVAYGVLGETLPGRHDLNRKRWALARLVLEDPVKMSQRFALLVAAHDAPLNEPDESLENIVRQGFDQVAGVTPEDRGTAPPDASGIG
jgi:hypothetical protein